MKLILNSKEQYSPFTNPPESIYSWTFPKTPTMNILNRGGIRPGAVIGANCLPPAGGLRSSATPTFYRNSCRHFFCDPLKVTESRRGRGDVVSFSRRFDLAINRRDGRKLNSATVGYRVSEEYVGLSCVPIVRSDADAYKFAPSNCQEIFHPAAVMLTQVQIGSRLRFIFLTALQKCPISY